MEVRAKLSDVSRHMSCRSSMQLLNSTTTSVVHAKAWEVKYRAHGGQQVDW